ncbi:EamA family transporter RarD [Antrihabitans spumae]|jgi:chloramphenicol-sensitive protein RarD|uniref:EamA family transporter RarD n=1 Tax=Antrihabitans spumae TaxID=3373370 RepID=A0ABW7K1P6_9NOCA
MWGLFPAFFGLLAFAGPIEILAHRILWTLAVMLIVLAVLGRLGRLRGIAPRVWLLVAAASAAIAINWGVYVYGVTSEQVVQCALGYFINPLVSVLLGVVIFRERLDPAQIVALVLAGVAVIVLTIDYGHPPYIALVLACSFATYGLVKKVVPLDPLRSLTAEGLVAAPFALAYIGYLFVIGTATVDDNVGQLLLLLVCGPVTTLPLLFFGAAAQRLPLVTMGILQYLTPALQMAWGVAVVGEDMPGSRWIGFGLIWIALVVFTTDMVWRVRRSRRPHP